MSSPLTVETTWDRYPLVPPADLDVHVWEGVLDLDQLSLENLTRRLTEPERKRASLLSTTRDRERFVARRGWLRVLLTAYTGEAADEVRIETDVRGRPRLAPGPVAWLRFSVASSGGLALYAFAPEREIGVDLEEICPELPTARIAARFFRGGPQPEHQVSRDRVPPAGFFADWTAREAIVKATGRGLIDLLDADPSSTAWHLTRVPVPPGFAACVAVERRPFDSGGVNVRRRVLTESQWAGSSAGPLRLTGPSLPSRGAARWRPLPLA